MIARPDRLRKALRALVFALAACCAPAAAQAPPAARELVRSKVAEILSRAEFAPRQDSRGLLARLADWLGWVIRGLVDALSDLPRWVVWLILIWMVLTLLAIAGHLIYVVFSASRGVRPAPGPGRGSSPGASSRAGVQAIDFDDAYRSAEARLAGGDWLGATRYLYVAAILWLDRTGGVRFRKGKSNHDYAAELRGRPELAPFLEMTRQFEYAVYGRRSPGVDSCAQMREMLDRLRRGHAK